MTEHLELSEKLLAQPEEVARDIYQAYQTKNINHTKRLWRWIMAIIKLLPEKLFKRLNL